MNKIYKKAMSIMMAILIWVSSAVPAFAATLQEETPAYNASKAVIMLEDISEKNQVQVIDLSGITKMSQAKKLLADYVPGRNVRVVSVDKELLGSWAIAAGQLGFKVKEKEGAEISNQALRALKPAKKYIFEIRTKKANNKFGLKEGVAVATAIAGIWAAFK